MSMNVLVIGLGSIAKKHIQALRKISPDIRIFALRSRRDAPSCDGITDVYSLDELDDHKIDFVIISTPTSEHGHSIEQALKLKCPLFIEKPLSKDLSVKPLVELIENEGILNYVACNLRFLDCLQFVRNRMQNGKHDINEVNVYCGSYLPDWRSGIDYKKCYSSIPSLGGGVNLDLIHEIDYLYWLLGVPEDIVSVLRHESTLGIDAIDYANYCLIYDRFCASVVLNYYRRDYKRTFEIVWDDETWFVDLAKNTVTCDDRIIFSSPQTIQDTYATQLEYFIDLIKNNSSKSFNTVSDAYNVLKIALPK